MKEQFAIPTPVEMKKIQEEAWDIKEEVDEVFPLRQKYEKMQKTADLTIKKRQLLVDFKREWEEAIKNLPEGRKPLMPISEKAIGNLYAAGHIFNKDFTMRHIVECLMNGQEVTDKIEFPKEGSRYFKLEAPRISKEDHESRKFIGLAGRFVIPNEQRTTLAEHVANWNQACEYKFRHGKKCAVIKKKDIPQWLIDDFESEFYVIIEKNEKEENGKIEKQIADGPSSGDSEGDWVISTVHFGEPSRIKPRPPREPKWDEIKNNPELLMNEIINFSKANSRYQKALDSYTDEQERVVFIDLEEKGVGQQSIKEERRIDDPGIAELVHDNEVLRKMLNGAIGEINGLKAEMKGIKTRMDKGNSKK